MIGAKKHRIRFQSKTITRDSLGGEIVSWDDEVQTWAKVEPLQGRELFAAQQIRAETSVRFRIRHREVQPEWRIVWQERNYDIVDVIDVDAEGREIAMLCATGVKADGG